MNIWNALKNLIKNGRQSKTADDSGDMLTASCDFLGQTRNVKGVTPYGFYNSPVLGSNWLIFSSRANSEDLLGIGNDYKNRPKNLEEGEVVLQNLLTGSYIKLLANGDIELITEADIIATAANITATATNNVTVTAGLNASINATNITATATVAAAIIAPTIIATATTATVTATNINLIGTVNITGSLVVNTVVFETHRHAPSIVPPSNP